MNVPSLCTVMVLMMSMPTQQFTDAASFQPSSAPCRGNSAGAQPDACVRIIGPTTAARATDDNGEEGATSRLRSAQRGERASRAGAKGRKRNRREGDSNSDSNSDDNGHRSARGGRGFDSDSCTVNRTSMAVSELSLCPWSVHTHTDVNRIPRDLPVAECRCRRCALENSLNVCAPVYMVLSVLRYDMSRGTYVKAWDKVPIACTCHAPSTQRPSDSVEPIDLSLSK